MLGFIMQGTRDPNTVTPQSRLRLLRRKLGQAVGMYPCKATDKATAPSNTQTLLGSAQGKVQDPKERDVRHRLPAMRLAGIMAAAAGRSTKPASFENRTEAAVLRLLHCMMLRTRDPNIAMPKPRLGLLA